MPLGESLAEFDIDGAAVWPIDDSRLEPIFLAGPLWIEFEEGAQFELTAGGWESTDPLVVSLGEFEELDPERFEEATDEPPAATRQRTSPTGVLGSVGIHLLVLLGLLTWSKPAGELTAPIPVSLVTEEKAPDNSAAPTETNAAAAEPPKTAAASPPPPPAQPKTAAKIAVPRQPTQRPERAAAAESAPKQNRPPSSSTEEARSAPKANATAPQPIPASHGRAPGPAMTREQYYAYLVSLTRQHLDLLPASQVSGRSGRTLVAVQVLRDGTIVHVGISQGSGYPDIDARIAQMVAAVGHFPPLPDAFPGSSANLEFKLLFPDVYHQ